jgi:uncharacterized coiled-coil protein SlyX
LQKGLQKGKKGQEGRERQEGREGQERREGRANPQRLPERGQPAEKPNPRPSHDEKKRADADVRKRQRAAAARQARIDKLETEIAECENAIREIEQKMSAPGFYEDRTAAQPVVDQHQALMWRVGDLMHQWEELQSTPDAASV